MPKYAKVDVKKILKYSSFPGQLTKIPNLLSSDFNFNNN